MNPFRNFFRQSTAFGDGPPLYRCFNDTVKDHSFEEHLAKELAFGCISDTQATRYADLPDPIREAIPIDDLSRLGRSLMCPKHPARVMVPMCPLCSHPVDPASATPEVGVWGLSGSGKSVFCACLMLAIEATLAQSSGIVHHGRFNRGRYKVEVMDRLVIDGLVPQKTDLTAFRRLVLELTRSDWHLRRLVTLTDLAGETYKDLLDPASNDELKARRRKPMLRTREAILLVNPESSSRLSVRKRDSFPYLLNVLEVLKSRAAGVLAQLSLQEINAAFRKMDAELEQPGAMVKDFDGPGHQYTRLAARLLSHIGLNQPDVTAALQEQLRITIAQIGTEAEPSDQVKDLYRYLSTWDPPDRPGDKRHMRIAVTITKSDVLSHRDQLPDERTVLAGLGPRSSKRQWHGALQALSDAGRAYLKEHDPDLVACSEENFGDVGYFFISSLGREAQPIVIAGQRAAASDDSEAPMLGGRSGASGRSATTAATTWELINVVRRNAQGRAPQPSNVLSPLLWLLTA